MSLEASDVVAFCTTSFKARYLVSLPGASLETRSAFTAFSSPVLLPFAAQHEQQLVHLHHNCQRVIRPKDIDIKLVHLIIFHRLH